MSARSTAPAAAGFHGLDEIALRSGGLLADRIGARRLLGLELERAWSRAVGARVRAVTRLHALREGVLEVHVIDAAWQRELRRLEREILQRLGGRLSGRPCVAIRFHVRAGWDRADAPAGPAADGAAGSACAAEGSGAPPLSDRLRRVMGRYLERSAAG